MKHRRGVSLLELLLAMTALSVILTLSVSLIHRIMQAQMRSRDTADAERTALRLANTFRRDVWQATSEDARGGDSTPGAILRLSLSNNRSLEYRREDAALVRLLKDGERTILRDPFMLPERAIARIEREADNVLLLSVVPPPAQEVNQKDEALDRREAGFALQVRARIGRDAAFVAREGESEAGP